MTIASGRPTTVRSGEAGGAAIGTYLEHVVADTAALVDALRAAPTAPVACYQGWTLVELAGHVGQIHRWVTGIVASRATERPTGGHVDAPAPDDLPEWVTEGAERLVAVLGEADAGEEVWTFGPRDRTVAFWHRRMALETALHRWDAEDAIGSDAVVEPWLALEGVEEALYVYLEPRVDGRDVGGDGQRVAFVPHGTSTTRGTDGWTVTLRPDGVEVEPGHAEADATVRGSALDVWLLLTCRRDLAAVEVVGDEAAAARAARAATLVPGPAG